MYLGIDLGTSNSAVVGSEGAELRLFKAEDGRDVLPSYIHISGGGAISVGARAYQQAEMAPGNVAQGFKRLVVAQFEDLASERFAALDKTLHDQLVARGEQAVASGDLDEVRSVIHYIINNRMVTSGPSAKMAVLAGLVR